MSPHARRTLHEALDLIIDALSEDMKPSPKRRKRNPVPLEPASKEDLELARISLKSKGLI